MVEKQDNMKIPSELIPKCPVCGAPMTMNLRCDDSFVQDERWYSAAERYEDFIRRHMDKHVLYLELGVGFNTPAIIKYPFWRMTAGNGNAVYTCINSGETLCPKEIDNRSIYLDRNIADILNILLQMNVVI